jgi:hypothetical protein
LDVEGLGRAEFWEAFFHKPASALPDRLQIRWAWSAAGQWLAADSARMQFARSPALYKIYVIRQLVKEEGPAADDPGAAFLRQFLPQLNQHLFPAAPS